MKQIVFILTLMPLFLLGQNKKQYFQIGPTVNIKKSSSLIGGTIGAGFMNAYTSIGLGLDVFAFEKSALIPTYADFKYYFSSSRLKKYFLLQPGYVIRSKTLSFGDTKIVEAGGVFAASGLGLIASSARFSFNFQLRYSLIATKATYQTQDGRYISSTKSSLGYFGLSMLFMPGNYN